MPFQVCMGANLQCSFGAAPSVLSVLPTAKVLGPTPFATIMDHVPMLNILPFGTCMSLANPMVASATAAAFGVLTPMPCIPVTSSPWIVGKPTILIGNKPALDDGSKCMCMWGGVIQVLYAGQAQVSV